MKFRIERLEERIAPSKWHGHGKGGSSGGSSGGRKHKGGSSGSGGKKHKGGSSGGRGGSSGGKHKPPKHHAPKC
jgi:hypothetical protein